MSQPRLNVSINVSLDDILWITEPFVTKSSMVIHHYEPVCHVWKMGCYLLGQGHSNWVWVHSMKSWLFLLYVLNCRLFGDQLSLTVHVHKLECLMKRLLCCIQGQDHSEGSELQWMFAWLIWSIKLSMVMHHQPGYHTEISFCYVKGQSFNRFYSIFRNTATFVTQISLMVHHHKTG